MRGEAAAQATMLTAVTPDALVPQGHPIRRIKPMVDSALAALSPTFSRMYASIGRPSIPPEHLLKGCLLMALFSVRSERQFCERLGYDMLFQVVPGHEYPGRRLQPFGVLQEQGASSEGGTCRGSSSGR